MLPFERGAASGSLGSEPPTSALHQLSHLVAARAPVPAHSRLCQADAMLQCSFPIAAVHGQRSIPTGGMAAMRTLLTFIVDAPTAALGPLRTFVDGAANGSKEPLVTNAAVRIFWR
jgi:hypothetical protein